jgi:hypothetical protein
MFSFEDDDESDETGLVLVLLVVAIYLLYSFLRSYLNYNALLSMLLKNRVIPMNTVEGMGFEPMTTCV